MRDAEDFTVTTINGEHFAIEIVSGPFTDHAHAWRWIDRQHSEGKRPPQLVSGGVKDRTAVDLTQIELILNTSFKEALARAVPQIEAVLRESYPEIPF
jgi:hypothetical protein